MLRNIRLRNFRSLRDTGDVELTPIVLLVGANDVGKSSLLRFFPLLAQTARSTGTSPLLWYVDDGAVDFGDFEHARLRGAGDPWIEVAAGTAGPGKRTGWPLHFASRIEAGPDGHTRVQRFTVTCLGDSVGLTIGEGGKLEGLSLNGRDLPPVAVRLAQRMPGPILHIEGDELVAFAVERIVEVVAAQAHGKLTLDELVRIVDAIAHGPAEHVLASLGNVRGGRSWQTAVAAMTPGGEVVAQIKALAFLRQLDRALDDLAESVRDHARGVRYLGPTRRPPQRFHRRAELGIDEIDRDGGNLAMFLDGLGSDERDGFSAWLRRHFDLGVRTERRDAHVCVIVDPTGRRPCNLIDAGYGTSQLLPIAAQCWLAGRQLRTGPCPQDRTVIPGTAPTLIALEQPELHLHPHRQARLADMFASTVATVTALGQPVCLCIETHSEPLVRRFGELVATGALRREDVSVLLFEPRPGGDESSVRPIAFAADGTLPAWPGDA